MDIPIYAQQAVRQFQATATIQGARSEDLTLEQVEEARDLWLESFQDCRAIDGSEADRDPAPQAIRLGEGEEEVLMQYSARGPAEGTMQSKLSPSESLYVQAELGADRIVAFRAAREGQECLMVGEVLDLKTMTGRRLVLETDRGYLLSQQ